MTPKEKYKLRQHRTRKQARDAAILRDWERREFLDRIQFVTDTTEPMTLSDGPPDSAADIVRDMLGYSL